MATTGTGATANNAKILPFKVSDNGDGTGTQNVTLTSVVGGGRTAIAGSIGNTKTLIKGSQAELGGWYIFNPNATTAYLQMFNAASTGAVALGTTTPDMSLGLPAGGGANVSSSPGIQFTAGLVIAVTTTRTGSSSPASTVDYNLFVT